MRIGARSALKIQFQIVGIINSLRYSAKKINSNDTPQSYADIANQILVSIDKE